MEVKAKELGGGGTNFGVAGVEVWVVVLLVVEAVEALGAEEGGSFLGCSGRLERKELRRGSWVAMVDEVVVWCEWIEEV